MKKNKIVISVFAVVCIISTIVGYSLLKQDSHKYGELAVMVKQDDGTYIRSTMSAFGNDDYEFDHAVCNNGTTVTANPNGGLNLKFLGTDKCTVYLKEKIKITDLEAFKASAKPSTSTMYSKVEPTNTISSVTDDNFSKKGEQTYTVDATHQNYYMTYASAYTFNTPITSNDYPTYTLTSPQVAKYSDIYSSLAGKYIVNYEGHNSSTAVATELNGNWNSSLGTYDKVGLDRIYKVVSATANSITYIPSSYTMEFADNRTTGVYTAEDDYGTSYYFRGNVTDNYVKFGKWTEEVYRGYISDQSKYKEYFTQAECLAAGTGTYEYGHDCNKSPVAGKDMYWRIVRINGDGSLRLMYDGTEAHANGTRSYDRFALSNQKFNTNGNNNAYVGYMYGSTTGTTYEEVHANINNSAIKTALDTWYDKNFAGTEYASKVGNMSFCNDRSIVPKDSSTEPGTGIGTTVTYYGAYGRLETNKSPSLICPQKENDLFTSNASIQGGNGKLDKPVGLLTADEAAIAGGVWNSSTTYNRGYYINKGNTYWLGSPSLNSNVAGGFNVLSDGRLFDYAISSTLVAVPVINIAKEYVETMTGNGTMDNPYIVTGELPEGYHTVTFNYNNTDGNWTAEECKSPMIFDSAANTCTKVVKTGEAYGQLPNTKNVNVTAGCGWHSYNGIWTAASGGTQITDTTIVTATSDEALFVQWSYACFVANTSIYTPKGYREIQNLKVGDEVYSYNEKTGLVEIKKITKTYIRSVNAYYEVRMNNGAAMKVTSGHLFYNPDANKWQSISEFNVGDTLMNNNKERVEIESSKIIYDTSGIKVYNFEVEDNHNYFVTNDNILTHNADYSSFCRPEF